MTPRSKKARKQLRMLVRKGEPGKVETETKRVAAIASASTSDVSIIVPEIIEVEEDVSMKEAAPISVATTRRNKIAIAREVINDIKGRPLAQARTGGFVKRTKTVDHDTAGKMKAAGKASLKIGGKVKTPDRRRF